MAKNKPRRSALHQGIWSAAHDCCEYCQVPQAFDALPFHIEHIIAKKHRGKTEADNLALSCSSCNLFKASNIAGRDPDTQELTRLFHPRTDVWRETSNGEVRSCLEKPPWDERRSKS